MNDHPLLTLLEGRLAELEGQRWLPARQHVGGRRVVEQDDGLVVDGGERAALPDGRVLPVSHLPRHAAPATTHPEPQSDQLSLYLLKLACMPLPHLDECPAARPLEHHSERLLLRQCHLVPLLLPLLQPERPPAQPVPRVQLALGDAAADCRRPLGQVLLVASCSSQPTACRAGGRQGQTSLRTARG